MFFASDNAGPAHPAVLQAIQDANQGFASAYGTDPISEAVRTQIRQIFETPDAAVYLVATGTAANALALATCVQPYDTVFCSPVAHINEDECNAPEFFTGGAKLTLVGDSDKMTAQALHQSISHTEVRGVHGPQRGAVSLTQVSERGSAYTLNELSDLCDIAKGFDLPVHLDGARFANALVTLDCSPAEMTWKAGVDVVSFGGTKNGCLGVEAVILFDPKMAWEFELRRKRAAHLFSKHRYLAAQMQAYLTNDLWLENAVRANANCARLAAGLAALPDTSIRVQPDANMLFCHFPRAMHQRLHDGGAQYYVWSGSLEGADPTELLEARLVCDWSLSDAQIDQFLALAKG